jgi:hypothetical protein
MAQIPKLYGRDPARDPLAGALRARPGGTTVSPSLQGQAARVNLERGRHLLGIEEGPKWGVRACLGAMDRNYSSREEPWTPMETLRSLAGNRRTSWEDRDWYTEPV